MSTPEELHDYIGLSDTSCDKLLSSSIDNQVLNFKETELRLGLPGLGLCVFGKDLEDEDKSVKNIATSSTGGAKRVFSDAYTNWVLGSDVDGVLGIFSVGENKTSPVSGHATAPAPKAQVVGWPPIRSFRKNTIATNLTKKIDVVEASSSSGCLYIKVSMDGAPYLRKVDLRTYCNYTQLSSALEKMFSCLIIRQCTSNGLPERGLSASNLKDLVNGSEYVLTYQDKDGDWMLVGDVPWDMFTDTCKRLRIMKGSEATGLAPRVTEKCKNHGY